MVPAMSPNENLEYIRIVSEVESELGTELKPEQESEQKSDIQPSKLIFIDCVSVFILYLYISIFTDNICFHPFIYLLLLLKTLK